MTRRSKRTRSGRYQRPPTTTPGLPPRPATPMRSRSGASRTAPRFRLIATASMLLPPWSFVRIAGGPGRVGARSRPAQPAVDRPRNSRLLLRDVDASLCQSLLRHRGQRHVRALARVSRNPRVCRDDRGLSDLPLRRGAGPLPTPETAVRAGATTRSRWANDTPEGCQRHAGRLPTTAQSRLARRRLGHRQAIEPPSTRPSARAGCRSKRAVMTRPRATTEPVARHRRRRAPGAARTVPRLQPGGRRPRSPRVDRRAQRTGRARLSGRRVSRGPAARGAHGPSRMWPRRSVTRPPSASASRSAKRSS
jgi:hypothetical protein